MCHKLSRNLKAGTAPLANIYYYLHVIQHKKTWNISTYLRFFRRSSKTTLKKRIAERSLILLLLFENACLLFQAATRFGTQTSKVTCRDVREDCEPVSCPDAKVPAGKCCRVCPEGRQGYFARFLLRKNFQQTKLHKNFVRKLKIIFKPQWSTLALIFHKGLLFSKKTR